ncbi:MAG: DUF1501 domain-containing protein, partial [Salinibacterium sp.]|nr:DUF1501 domain-containing protein [Salinibacterium sp.]
FLDGWLNRHLKTGTSPQDAVRALALTKTLPRIMAGSSPAYAVDSISDMAFVATAPDARAILEHMLEKSRHEVEGRPIAGVQHGIGDALELIDFFSGVDPTSYLPFNGAVYPTSDLGGRLQEIAQLIRADLGIEFFHADTGGWDHHTSLDTNIATFGGGLDAALSAFLQDLGAMMGSVVVLVMSEFGRESALNGSGGVDHGVGGGMLVMGGSCQGGQVHGTWPGLAPAALEDGRFLAPANDFRDVVLEVLDSHMGGVVPAEVFPGHNYNPLGIM